MQDAGAPERGGVASNRDGARVRASGSWDAICSQEGDASYRRLENVALLPSGWEAEVGRLESPEVSTSEYCMYAY